MSVNAKNNRSELKRYVCFISFLLLFFICPEGSAQYAPSPDPAVIVIGMKDKSDRPADFSVSNSETKDKVGPVPPELGINPFYKKYLDAGGISVITSEHVSNEALIRTQGVITVMLSKRPDVKRVMVENSCKVMIIGRNEEVCDLPEYAHICDTPENIAYWNKRARGFGGAPEDTFSASFGEENVLCLEGDRYKGESILVHEFAHLIHTVGIVGVNPDFDAELETLRQHAIEKGCWENTYAITNKEEYFAEGVQSFFNCNRYAEKPNGVHNAINTREKLKAYDPEMYALLLRYFPESELDLCD